MSIITTGGSLSVTGDADGADCTAAQVCASQTDETGTIVASLAGINRAGLATITVIAGDLTATAEVVLFGPVDRIEASPEQGSIEIGGSTFIVVTAYDSGNNPVSGTVVDVATKSNGSPDITSPADKATVVNGNNDVDKDANGNQAVDKGDIPACGDDTTAYDAGTNGVTTGSLGTANSGTSVARGTNLDGQCVIEISAPKKDVGAAADATRGLHSIVINALSGDSNELLDTYTRNTKVDKVTVELQVGGPPSSVTSDASEYVDPLSSTKITYTVWDDEDVRVGEVDVVIDQIEGDGKITAGEGTGRTKDGQGSFTFRAPLNEGTAVFLVTVNPGTSGEIQQPISVVVGEAMPEEPDMPSMPDGDATLMVQGNLGSFSGGSVDALAAAANAACPGGSQIAVQDGDGEWNLWSSTAPAFALIGFTTTFADGFGAGTLVWVTSCEADAMDSEGSMGSEG